jgi:hypothetical protein
LFEHFLHPYVSYFLYICLSPLASFWSFFWRHGHFFRYPKDSEKLMLARQTGLTRSQVFYHLTKIFVTFCHN